MNIINNIFLIENSIIGSIGYMKNDKFEFVGYWGNLTKSKIKRQASIRLHKNEKFRLVSA